MNSDKRDLPENIPYLAYEDAIVTSERHVKRLIFIIGLLIVMLTMSNMAWLYAWMQYDYESSSTQTIDVDGKDGNANYISNGGSIVNGEDNNKKH